MRGDEGGGGRAVTATALGDGTRIVIDDGRRVTLLTRALLAELGARLDELAIEADKVRFVMLCGNARGSFAAGADLSEIAALDPLAARQLSRRGQQVANRLSRNGPWPTASFVDGHAFGGGFDLALSCDLVFATPAARFCHPGLARGLFTGWGGTERLPRMARGNAAWDALLSGVELDADAAERAGLALQVPAGEQGLAEAALRLERLAAWPRAALDQWRAAARGAAHPPLQRALARLAAAGEGGRGPGGS